MSVLEVTDICIMEFSRGKKAVHLRRQRNLQTIFQSGCTNLHSTNSVQGFPLSCTTWHRSSVSS